MTVTAHRTGAALGNIEDLLVSGEDHVSQHTVLTRVGDPALRQAIEAFDGVMLDAASPHYTLSLSALDLLRARAAAVRAGADAAAEGLRHDEQSGAAGGVRGPGGHLALEARHDAVTALSSELARAVEAAEQAAESIVEAVSESAHDLGTETASLNGEQARQFAASLRQGMVDGLVSGVNDVMSGMVSDAITQVAVGLLSAGSLRLRTTVRDESRWEVSLVLPGTWGATEAETDAARRELRDQLNAAFGDLAASSLSSAEVHGNVVEHTFGGPTSDSGDDPDDLGDLDAVAEETGREAVEAAPAARLRAAAEDGDLVVAIRAAAELLGIPLRDVLRAAKVKPSSFYSWEQATNATKSGTVGRPLRPRRGSIGLVWALVQAVEDLSEVIPVGLDRWLTMDEARLTTLVSGEFDDLVELATTSTLRHDAARPTATAGGLSRGGRGSRPSGVYHDDGGSLFNPGTRPGLPMRKGTAAVTPRRAARRGPASGETEELR